MILFYQTGRLMLEHLLKICQEEENFDSIYLYVTFKLKSSSDIFFFIRLISSIDMFKSIMKQHYHFIKNFHSK
jgi:hypothetical protein